jgi:hypothetical protein
MLILICDNKNIDVNKIIDDDVDFIDNKNIDDDDDICL